MIYLNMFLAALAGFLPMIIILWLEKINRDY